MRHESRLPLAACLILLRAAALLSTAWTSLQIAFIFIPGLNYSQQCAYSYGAYVTAWISIWLGLGCAAVAVALWRWAKTAAIAVVFWRCHRRYKAQLVVTAGCLLATFVNSVVLIGARAHFAPSTWGKVYIIKDLPLVSARQYEWCVNGWRWVDVAGAKRVSFYTDRSRGSGGFDFWKLETDPDGFQRFLTRNMVLPDFRARLTQANCGTAQCSRHEMNWGPE